MPTPETIIKTIRVTDNTWKNFRSEAATLGVTGGEYLGILVSLFKDVMHAVEDNRDDDGVLDLLKAANLGRRKGTPFGQAQKLTPIEQVINRRYQKQVDEAFFAAEDVRREAECSCEDQVHGEGEYADGCEFIPHDDLITS